MFKGLKTAAIKSFINPYLEGIGSVEEIEIDKKAKSIVARVVMAGESLPVRIEVHGYHLGADFITIPRFICSKPWVEAALNRFLANQPYKIPEKARSVIKLLL